MFQFLNGSINMYAAGMGNSDMLPFQFLNGSINIIRKRSQTTRRYIVSIPQCETITVIGRYECGFNSSMVRLICCFCEKSQRVCKVSIPQWFD